MAVRERTRPTIYFDARTGSAVGCRPSTIPPIIHPCVSGHVVVAASVQAAMEGVIDHGEYVSRPPDT